MSLFCGCFTADGFPFWAFVTFGVTWVCYREKDVSFVFMHQVAFMLILHKCSYILFLNLTFETVALDGGLTAVEGLLFVDTPGTAGWLLGLGCGCGSTGFEVFLGTFLLLEASVVSVVQDINIWWMLSNKYITIIVITNTVTLGTWIENNFLTWLLWWLLYNCVLWHVLVDIGPQRSIRIRPQKQRQYNKWKPLFMYIF